MSPERGTGPGGSVWSSDLACAWHADTGDSGRLLPWAGIPRSYLLASDSELSLSTSVCCALLICNAQEAG